MKRIRSMMTLVVAGACVALMACGGAEPDPGTSTGPGGKADWLGNGELDETCTWDWQCSADQGLVCRPINYNYDPEYRCLPRGEDRDPCIRDEHCLAGLSCNSVSRSLLGTVENAGMCYPGGRCSKDTDCVDLDAGKVCRPTRWKAGEPDFYCRERGLPGNVCGEDDDCSDGLRCAGVTLDMWGQVYKAGTCETDPYQ